MHAPVFTCFPKLPLELRDVIWNETMPSDDGPVMYPFGDHFINYTTQPAESAQPLMVQIPMPPALFVCREARRVAERWMASVNGWLHFRRETQGHIAVRAWNEETDLLYIPRPKWRLFSAGMFEEAPEEGSIYERMYARVRNLALPAFTAYYSLASLVSAMDLAPNLTAVHVVWGPLPNVRASAPGEALEEAAVQPRWAVEVEDSEVVRMCCHDERSGVTTWETGELEDWMYELHQEMALQEDIPEQYIDDEKDVVKLPFRPVRLKNK
ncbi:unnamed protein product [Clonostachys chloroleuca]|uniref:2EXR domain-containing protein n=1 Tax=Clonostachys chloroleuca TaxID=1926264 RepID=A0AA35VEW9_9HYPO|nr:unnamed protein product [Clonostachys chloroleuca]